MRTDIVILAAGQGSRMKSSLPKVLHPVAGRPMLAHVIEAAKTALASFGPGQIHGVIGHGGGQVREALSHHQINWVEQHQQLGTGHALRQALPALAGADQVLVLYGDVPLISAPTLQRLAQACQGQKLALLTATLADPTGYGRIVRNQQGAILAIVEHKDATASQRAIDEINTGIMAIPGHRIHDWLNALGNDNAQGEYYLTDIVAQAVAEGAGVVHARPDTLAEVQGVNSRQQLSVLEREYQRRCGERLMAEGVTLIDPQRLDVRGEVSTGQDVLIDINVVLEGLVVLGNGVVIEPGCIIRNSRIADGAVIRAHSIIEDATVASGCEVGPFARLRPGSVLAEKARVGNFVEIKKTTIGAGSKVNHLSYIGDADLGAGVNIGAGTITCNYDGVNKHRTVVGDGAFIGTNSALVAPVTIGAQATTAAGSVITVDVAENELAVARGRQRNINGWHRPVKKAD